MENRAHSVFTIKSIDEDQRIIEGVATTPTPDRTGDIVEPKGAVFKLPVPFLLHHDTKQQIGNVISAKVTADGIAIKAQVAKGIARVDDAWAEIKAGFFRGLSIGFRGLERTEIKDTFATHFHKWEWLELSAVTVPANQEASITVIKSLDTSAAASGIRADEPVKCLTRSSPGVSGKQHQPISMNPKGNTMAKTTRELIEGFEAKRAASDARMDTIMDEAEGATLDAEQKEEYDGLEREIKEVDEHITRLKKREAANIAKATAVKEVATAQDDAEATGASVRQGVRIAMGKSMLPPGIAFTRYALCHAQARGNLMQAEVLSRRFTDTPEVNLACKAAVAAGTTQDATWASPLVQLTNMASEFVEYLRPQTIIGQLPLRRVPFNIKFTRQTSGTLGTFVGEGLPKPLGKMDFESLSLTFAKAATIIVMTQELVRFSDPSSELLARNDLAAGIAQYLDKRFIDPQYAGVANVSPASITNGVVPIASLGTTVALITDTVKLAIDAQIAANSDLTGLVWVMSPSIALDLSLKRTTQDIFAFPDITAKGGTFFGFPVVTSNNVVLGGSPTESFIVLLDPSEIMLADDGGVTIDLSQEASIEMSNTPVGGATSLVSLWQNNLVALRAERFINWRKRRDSAVTVITMNVLW